MKHTIVVDDEFTREPQVSLAFDPDFPDEVELIVHANKADDEHERVFALNVDEVIALSSWLQQASHRME